MRLLNTLYLQEPGLRVSTRSRSLELRLEGKLLGRVPLEGLEGVVAGPRVEMTTEALGRCCDSGIRVSVLSHFGRLRFSVGGPTRGNVNLRVAQVLCAEGEESGQKVAAAFVAGKLQNQRRLLLRWSWDATGATKLLLNTERLRIEKAIGMVSESTSGDSLRGIEGSAARSYFKGMGAYLERTAPDFPFTFRSKRPPLDPTNALLSYCYGLAVSEAIGALDAIGLDPQVGFLHELRPGRPSLALDLVEEMRPMMDRFALRLITKKILSPVDFVKLPNGSWRLDDRARKMLLEKYEVHRSEMVIHPLFRRLVPKANLMAIQATILARTIRGDLPGYLPYVMDT